MKQLFLLFFLAGSAVAQNFTTVTATQIQDASGAPLSSGQLCVSGVSPTGQLIPFRAGGGGMVHSEPVCTSVYGGHISPLSVANSNYTMPLNVAYVLTVTDNVTGQTILSLGPTQITGSTWSIDTFTPNLPTLALIQTGPTGLTGATGTASVVTSNGSNGDFLIAGRMISKAGPAVDVLAYGVAADGVTDDTTNFQAAVDAAAGKKLLASGSFKLGIVNLHSNSQYDFTTAKFQGTSSTQMFVGTSLSNVIVQGGSFSTGSFSPTYTQPNGTYWSGVPITFNGCTNIAIKGQSFTNAFGNINIYNSSMVEVSDTQSVNSNAGIAVVNNVGGTTMHGISIHDNVISGGGDDDVAIGPTNTSGYSVVTDVLVAHNVEDKTRIPAGTTAAVGIRVGPYSTGSGTGLTSKVQVIGNNLKDMTQEGIIVFGTQDSVVANNSIDGYARYGVSSAMQVGSQAATAVNASGIVVMGNKAAGAVTAGAYGILGDWIANSTFSGNQFSGSPTGGFGTFDCNNCAGNIIEANTFTNTAGPALSLRSSTSSNNHVHHNYLTPNVGGGVTTPGGAGTGNIVEKNFGDSIGDIFFAPGAGLNAKYWSWLPTAGGLLMGYALDDTQAGAVPWVQVTRSGTTISDTYFQGTTTSARQLVLTGAPGIISSPSSQVVLAPGGVNTVVTTPSGVLQLPTLHSTSGSRTLCVGSDGTVTSVAGACPSGS